MIKRTVKCKYCRKRISEKVSLTWLAERSLNDVLGTALCQLHDLAGWARGLRVVLCRSAIRMTLPSNATCSHCFPLASVILCVGVLNGTSVASVLVACRLSSVLCITSAIIGPLFDRPSRHSVHKETMPAKSSPIPGRAPRLLSPAAVRSTSLSLSSCRQY